MTRTVTKLLVALLLTAVQTLSAQERRPIDNQHPLWMIHIDVWNTADPQKIIDLIPDDIKPYVCMNLSLSCQYDTERGVYKMPRCAVRTYKSWGSVCQQNGLWFTCQPASGGHTHIQDDDLETFEYFFKQYPNFLGWNYAEQFWGFDEAGDKSSSPQTTRLALFAKLVPMHHKYGGFLTVSFCGNIWSHPLNPLGMMKRNKDLLQACKDYPEAILWLYKYTTSSCWYNNESVTFGPFIAGLAKNYGVRYDNCGWNGALDAVLGEGHGRKYPGAAGIGTVMEQTCSNGGAVWDGPELIWTEDFENKSNTTVDGYTRRNWGTFSNFRGVWMDMFRQVINGTMYIPTREEVIGKTKIVIRNDVSSGSDEDKYAAWGDLYDGLYKQTDPFNPNNGQWMNNYCYFKKTGRYGAIPIVIGLYDDLAKSIPVQVSKSQRSSRWGTQTKKVNDFNTQYPEVSTGDLFVNRYRNQLVTYTPYSYLNTKKRAKATIPLQYNTCESLTLNYAELSSGLIREFSDHIEVYLNNFRSDQTTSQLDTIIIAGTSEKPTQKLTKHGIGTSSLTGVYDEENHTYTLSVKHFGPLTLNISCTGDAVRTATDAIEITPLGIPQQAADVVCPVIIEAEDMDYKSVKAVQLSNSGWYFPEVTDYAGNGYVDMGTNTTGSLRHQLNCKHPGNYTVAVRYCNSSKAGQLKAVVNCTAATADIEKTSLNDWRKATFQTTLKEGQNDLRLNNTAGISMYIDQIIYIPEGTETEKFLVTVRDDDHGTVVPNVSEAAEGETVTLTVKADAGYQLKELRVINSIYYTMEKTIDVSNPNEITFVMPDDNVTLQPVFADVSSLLKLDFSSVLAGAIPEGWRTTDGTDVHEYPNTYSSGSRTMAGFTGHQGKGLYWRNTSAEYGRLSAYPLTLDKGGYRLTYAMAAWKGSPQYKAQILDSKGTVVAQSAVLTATPNANGVTSANLTSAQERELDFTINEKGNYIVRFLRTSSGFDEYLLLECRINSTTTGIQVVDATGQQLRTIYDLSGRQRNALGNGLNIIRTADGKTRKVLNMK